MIRVLIECQPSIDRDVLSKCQSNINQVSVEGINQLKGNDRQSTVDASMGPPF